MSLNLNEERMAVRVKAIAGESLPSYIPNQNQKIASFTSHDTWKTEPASVYMKACKALVEDNLNMFKQAALVAKNYNILGDLASFTEKLAESNKPKTTIKQASSRFLKMSNSMPIEARASAARKICSASLTDVPDKIKAYAGKLDTSYVTHSKAFETISKRASSCKDIHYKKLYENIAETVKIPQRDLNIVKLANAIEAIDRFTGFYPYVSNEKWNNAYVINDPLDELLEKSAQLKDDTIRLIEEAYTLKEMCKIPEKVFRKALTKDLVDSVMTAGSMDPEKLEQILPTLPRPEKAALEKYIKCHVSNK